MSIFPNDFYTGGVPAIETPTYSLTDYLINMETGEIVLDETGRAIIVEGIDALNCQIWRKLHVREMRYLIYTPEYGNTLDDLFGKSKAYADSVINMKIHDAVVDDYYVLGIKFLETDFDGSTYYVNFQIDTVFGVLDESLTINID